MPQERTLGAVMKSMTIIEFIHEHGGATVSTLSTELEMPKSTLYPHLNSLIKKRFLIKQGETYKIAFRLFNIGHTVRRRHPGYNLIYETVETIAQQTSEEVDYSVEEYGKIIVLIDEYGHRSGRGSHIGEVLNVHSTAAGKAILAHRPTDYVDTVLQRWPLTKDATDTITTETAFRDELDTTHERGYAIIDEELVEGVHSVGMPVTGPGTRCLGAITVSGPKYRFTLDDTLIELLNSEIDTLEQQLAENWPLEPASKADETRNPP